MSFEAKGRWLTNASETQVGGRGRTPMTRALPSVTTAYHEATQTLGTGGLDLRCVILDKLLHVSVLVPEHG